MHQLKAVRAQALTTREMAQIGLFTALIAAGAFIKINIPVQPFPMHFTLQFLFVLLAGFILGAKRGAICVGIYLAVGLCGIPVFAAHLQGSCAYDEPDYHRGCAFLIGNEGNGLTEELTEKADTLIRIPMEGQLESLNAGVASALLMYEAYRQRRLTLTGPL